MTGRAGLRRPALVGRDSLLAEAGAVLRRRDSLGVVLVGEEGVGKSRLAGELLHAAESRGVAVRRAVATRAAGSVPFGVLADLIPADLQAASPFDLMRLTVQRLRGAGSRHGLVLAVDDAHLLDEPSAALVAHVVRAQAARVLLVLREGAPGPDALMALVKDGTCAQVRVPPLGEDDVARLCAELLGGPVEGATRRRLVELAAGNLILLHELVDAGLADGALRRDGGIWQASPAWSPSARLRPVVEARLDRLGDGVRDLAEMVALAGTLELELLERLVGADALLEAERARVVTVRQDGRRLHVALSHPLHAEVLRAAVPRLAARTHHRRLGEELARTGCRRGGDVLRLVTHRLDAGAPVEEALVLQAAGVALVRFDVARAVRLTTAAVEAGGSRPARLAAAQALYAAGRSSDAEGLLAALQAEAVDADEAARVTLVRAANLISGFGRSADAERLVRDAIEALGEGSLRDELAALGGMIALSRGRPRQALIEVEPLLSRPGLDQQVRVRGLLVAVSALGQVGRADDAIAAGEPVRDEAEKGALPAELEAALVGLCYAYGAAGRLDEAESLARARYDAALEERAADLRTLWALALGQGALSRGVLPEAERHLREAAVLLRQDQSLFGVYSLAWCLGCLAESAGLRGDAAAARAVLDEAYAVTPEPCFVLARELARVWVVHAESTAGAAVVEALDVARQARELEVHVAEVVALHYAARLGCPDAAAGRLAQLADSVDGQLVRLHTEHARSLAAGDAEGLDQVATRYECCGLWLDAAEAAAQAAVAHAHQGHAGAATRATQRSAQLAPRCAGANTPALVLKPVAAHLTRRELEIADLAARGWTTSQIADALVLSTRTVENHLHRAYTKLGIGSRRELAEMLVP